jgi:hypothetical protein
VLEEYVGPVRQPSSSILVAESLDELARLRKELDSTAREITRCRAQIDANWEFIKRLTSKRSSGPRHVREQSPPNPASARLVRHSNVR